MIQDNKPSPVYVDLHRSWEEAEKQVQVKLDRLCESYRQLGELQGLTEERRHDFDDAMCTSNLCRIKMHDYANDVRNQG